MRTPLARSRSIALACTVLVAASCGGTVGSVAPSVAGGARGRHRPLPYRRCPGPRRRIHSSARSRQGSSLRRRSSWSTTSTPTWTCSSTARTITVPAGIGINIEDPDVRKFDNPVGYGGIEMCAQPCISPLHTHDETGVLHTESMDPEPHTLGQFFVEWGVELSETCVGEHCDPTPIAVYVDGEPYEGDPRAIELTDEKVIVIAIGTPPEVIPSTYDFSNA